jgi:hypothetical protein
VKNFYDVLQTIRQRPPLYIEQNSIKPLRSFIHTDIFEVSVSYGSFRLERAASQMPQGSPENAQLQQRSHPTLISASLTPSNPQA